MPVSRPQNQLAPSRSSAGDLTSPSVVDQLSSGSPLVQALCATVVMEEELIEALCKASQEGRTDDVTLLAKRIAAFRSAGLAVRTCA